MRYNFLPVSRSDMDERGWKELDVVLVTGDAYVDHASYGAAVIGRALEDAGLKVGIIAQPDWRKADDFKKLGRPGLFFGVTAGNLDSMVANYTANKKPRKKDDYSPGGLSGLRPDRATIVYSNRIREAFSSVPIALGGVEASLRRLAHYDYWSDKVRRSVLVDSKADILVYGMGERPMLEIAERLRKGEDAKALNDIKGTVVIRKKIDTVKDCVELPSFEEVSGDTEKFNRSFKAIYLENDPIRGKAIAQRHGDRYVIQNPPAIPLTIDEMDKIYGLSYARSWHPVYDRSGGVPGYETVRFSIISHRGCCGECAFCSLYFHQGRVIQSRSADSIVGEISALARQKDFRGTITDIGGPTANLYQAKCALWEKDGACRDKRCLTPGKCQGLKLGYREMLDLWERIKKIPKVKHVFVGSGVRYDLLVDKYSDEYLKSLCAEHVSGQLKVAPEHTSDAVLDLMNKPHLKVYESFVERFNSMNKRLNKKQYLVNYFLSGHPGSSLKETLEMSLYLLSKNIHPEQIQDFIPLPMTLSGCIYHTGKDPFTGKKIYVPKAGGERGMSRALIQYNQPRNKRLVLKALKVLHRPDLIKKFFRV